MWVTSTFLRFFAAMVILVCGCGKGATTTVGSAEAKTIAQCLTAKNAVMYGAFWCPHCAKQKEAFGEAFEFVTYVECSNSDRSQNDTCKAKDIASYPTWIFANDERVSGAQTLAALAAKSGCATGPG